MPKHKLGEGKDEPPGKRHQKEVTEPFLLLPPLLVDPWTVADIPRELPPLPRILKPEIENEVFTHPGYPGDGPSYERLEWLGDAYLEMIATSLIFQTFTRMPSGRCSQMRELLIRNTTLAQYFRKYGMAGRAKMPADISTSVRKPRGRSSDKDLIKIQGDMFEAYVAGIVVSNPAEGLAVASRWLRALFSTSIKDEIARNEEMLRSAAQRVPATTHSASKDMDTPGHSNPASRDLLNLPPRDQLTRLIGVKGTVITYKEIPGPEKDERLGLPLYTFGVYLTGWGETERLLGKGTALSKKEAGQLAAKSALDQRELMASYQSQKRALVESQGPAKPSNL